MRLTRILSFLLGTLLFLGVVGAIAAWLVYEHFSQDLPDYYQLASYDPPVVVAHLCRRRPPAGRIRHREPRLRADHRDAEARHQRVPGGRGQDLLHPSRRRSARRHQRGVDQRQESRRRPPAGRRLHHHAAGDQELPADERGLLRAQDPRDDPGAAHREGLHQGPHPRALSQPDLSRLRQLRRRRRGAQLLQQVAGRADDRRGGLSRRAAQGAEQLQHRARSRRRRSTAATG